MLKIALGVGGAIVGAVLAVSGYVADAPQQIASAIQGIYALMVWIPAGAYVLSLFVVHKFYSLDSVRLATIEKALFHTPRNIGGV